MKTFLLVIILGFYPGEMETGETHVAIIMPDEETCEALRDAYVHAVDIRWDPNGAHHTADFYDPFFTLQDERTELAVVEVRCESSTDDS
jgi:hypothetical protein